MRILVIGNASSVFLYEYIINVIDKSNNEISIMSFCSIADVPSEWMASYNKANIKIDFQPEQGKKRKKNKLLAIKNLLRYKIVRNYDFVHLFGVPKLSFAAALFSSTKTNIIVSYLGSDLLKAPTSVLKAQTILLRRAKYITLSTDYLIDSFKNIYGETYNNKLKKIKYGTNNAEIMERLISTLNREECKELFGFSRERICIFCGYNGNENQQHLKIINQISKLNGVYKDRILLVFHCSYGLDCDYEKRIKKRLAECSLPYIFINRFMTGVELAELRLCTDVLINLQLSDAMSASMIECLEAGAIIIKGDWLVYPDLKDNYLVSIKDIDDLPSVLVTIIDNYEAYHKRAEINRGVLSNLLSWSNCKEQWQSLLLDNGESK